MIDPEEDAANEEEYDRYQPEDIFDQLAEAVFPEFDDIVGWEEE